MERAVEVTTVVGEELEPYVSDLAKLRIEVFREYPYLYDGSLEYEESYLRSYARSRRSLFVIAKEADQVVGVSTGMPLADSEDAFQAAFVDRGYDLNTVYYFGESVLRREYRGSGIGSRFMREREALARGLEGITLCAFCAVARADDDPRKPSDYRPLDAFWRKYGFEKKEELRTTFSWKEIGESEESDKPMVFWVKSISG